MPLTMKNKEGWDGKMRVDRKAVLANPEALEDSDNSKSDASNEVEEIAADEGKLSPQLFFWPRSPRTGTMH